MSPKRTSGAQPNTSYPHKSKKCIDCELTKPIDKFSTINKNKCLSCANIDIRFWGKVLK